LFGVLHNIIVFISGYFIQWSDYNIMDDAKLLMAIENEKKINMFKLR
jgi:hypothetical protein